jgi:hypothetical protein
MHSAMKIWLILAFAALAGGCATSGPKFAELPSARTAPQAGEGRIYIYRTALYGAAVQPEVKMNGDVVGRAVPNGFFFVDRKPGNYEITTTTEVERKLSLTLEAGQVRYVKLNLSIGFVVGHVYAELMENDVGAKEIADLRFTGN